MDDQDDDDGGAAGGASPKGRAKGKGKARREGAKVEPSVVNARAPRSGVQIKKKDFVDQVTAASGAKKGDVRGIVDATLKVLSERLLAGDELTVPPLGKLRLLREKDNGKMRIATLRLQVAAEGERPPAPLAEDGD